MSHCHMGVFVEQFMTQKYKRNAARLRVQRQIDLGSADTSGELVLKAVGLQPFPNISWFFDPNMNRIPSLVGYLLEIASVWYTKKNQR